MTARKNESREDYLKRRRETEYYADHEGNKQKLRERWAQMTPERKEIRKVHMQEQWQKRRYNLTPEDRRKLLEIQGGGCALCEKPDGEGHERLCTDHDHETGRVRGLLCRKCNTALGRLGDTHEKLLKVTLYLKPIEC